jgi:hypothetical protein
MFTLKAFFIHAPRIGKKIKAWLDVPLPSKVAERRRRKKATVSVPKLGRGFFSETLFHPKSHNRLSQLRKRFLERELNSISFVHSILRL